MIESLRVLADADDQREPEAFPVGAIQAPESFELLRGQSIEPRRGLLVRGLRRERALLRLTAGELGMRPEQLELTLAGRLAHRRLERGLELSDSAKRPPAPRRLGDPRRVFE